MKLDLSAISATLAADRLWEKLTDEQIADIQGKCQAQFDADAETCQEWRDKSKRLMDMAKMAKKDRKAFIRPWQSDIQVPDLIQSAIQFNARSFPEYAKDGKVCQPKLVGRVDPKKQERADRVCDHVNWQLNCQMPEWLPNLDKMLLVLPIVGHAFRVKAYDNRLGRLTDTLCMPDQVTVNNAPNNPDWDRRIAVEYPISKNYAATKRATKDWRDVELENTGNDDDPKYAIVDIYTWYDLDGDGYEEPYTITVEKSTFNLLSIVPRWDVNGLVFTYDPAQPDNPEARELVGIEALELATSYGFIPSPDGTALCIGYGHIGEGMINGMNMYLNQLADAGTLANLGGGFIKKGTFRDDGTVLFEAGEFKITDSVGPGPIGDNIMPLPVPQPSAVTFSVYEEMKKSFSSIAATSEIVSGTDMPSNTPATSVLAIIDQAKQGARAILKRINIAMGKEFEVIFRLNKATLPNELYFSVGDFSEQHIAAEDYDLKDYDIIPVADPNFSSRTERLTRAQAAMQLGIQSQALLYDTLIDLGYSPDKAKEYLSTNQNPGVQAAQAQMQAAEAQEKAAKAQSDMLDKQIKLMDAQTRSIVGKTTAIKNLADAEAAEAGVQLDIYAAQMAALQQESANERTDAAGLSAMAGQPGNEAGDKGISEDGEGAGQLGQDTAGSGLESGGEPVVPAGEEGGDGGAAGLVGGEEAAPQGE